MVSSDLNYRELFLMSRQCFPWPELVSHGLELFSLVTNCLNINSRTRFYIVRIPSSANCIWRIYCTYMKECKLYMTYILYVYEVVQIVYDVYIVRIWGSTNCIRCIYCTYMKYSENCIWRIYCTYMK